MRFLTLTISTSRNTIGVEELTDRTVIGMTESGGHKIDEALHDDELIVDSRNGILIRP